jgi:hypothetical protein
MITADDTQLSMQCRMMRQANDLYLVRARGVILGELLRSQWCHRVKCLVPMSGSPWRGSCARQLTLANNCHVVA